MSTTTSLRKSPARHWPMGMFDDFHADLEKVWDRAMPMLPRSLRIGSANDVAWYPRLDVFENNGDIVVKTDLPGIDKDDIQITIENGSLVLTGEREEESEVDEKDFYRHERSHGSFMRSLPLPFDADADDVKAVFLDGVLEIRIPVPEPTEEEPAKTVAIS